MDGSARPQKRIEVVAISLLLVLVWAATASSAPPRSVRVELRPATVNLGQRTGIVVSHIQGRSVQVLVKGATRESGEPFQWQSLRLVDGSWRGSLPSPALRGVYPILLRVGGARFLSSPRWLLRVFEPGTGSRPSFDGPAEVVDWWVRAVAGGTLVAVKEWPLPDFDRRDPALHRLFVVAYSPPGHPDETDRLGTFVTAVRDGYQGHWRFLEATLEP
jgi:hypothetical protein